MKKRFPIVILWTMLLVFPEAKSQSLQRVHFDFYGDTLQLPFESASFVDFTGPLSETAIQSFYEEANKSHFEPV
ncbi:MAG TPA: hypothetical protein VFI06_11430, partial [Chitinophagaceae bacterium]|nr:hypothetical protein [Chitinophagaceae bacterium]